MKKNLFGLYVGALFNLFLLSGNNSEISEYCGDFKRDNLKYDKLMEYDILIDKSNKKLYFFDNDSVFSFSVGVGKVGRETPCKDFEINVKAMYPAWNPRISSAANPLAREYLINHGPIPNRSSLNPLNKYWIGIGGSYGIHDTKSDDGIGEMSSLGCVRMRTSDLDFLYPRLREGMSGRIFCDSDEDLSDFVK